MQNRKRDTDVQNKLLDSVGESEGGIFWENSIETCYILSRVKQITSPGWMHETSAQGWCTGKTQRDRVEREVGGGIGMGNTCISKADSCQWMAKTTTIKKRQINYVQFNPWNKMKTKKITKILGSALWNSCFQTDFLAWKKIKIHCFKHFPGLLWAYFQGYIFLMWHIKNIYH